MSGPPHVQSGASLVESGVPSSASSRATRFERPMPRCARRAVPKAPRTAPFALNARAFDSGAPLTTADARLAAGGTPSFVADSPLKLSGAWMPPSGARHKAACARASAALQPQAECGGPGKRGGPQSVWLGAQGFLLGTPGERAGTRAPVRDLEVSTVLVIVRAIQIQTLGGGAWERVLGCWGGASGCRGGMLGLRWAERGGAGRRDAVGPGCCGYDKSQGGTKLQRLASLR